MTPAAFRAWRDRMELSLSGTALVIGKCRRTVANYQSGRTPVDEAVARLCKWLERDQRKMRRKRA